MYADTMIMPALPDLIKEFQVSYSMSAWFLTSYLISGAVMTPIAGKLSDMYGKKRLLIVIMIIYAAGISVAGFATNIVFMFLARVIQGVGISMLPIAFSWSEIVYPRKNSRLVRVLSLQCSQPEQRAKERNNVPEQKSR
jgi:MFS family permease